MVPPIGMRRTTITQAHWNLDAAAENPTLAATLCVAGSPTSPDVKYVKARVIRFVLRRFHPPRSLRPWRRDSSRPTPGLQSHERWAPHSARLINLRSLVSTTTCFSLGRNEFDLAQSPVAVKFYPRKSGHLLDQPTSRSIAPDHG
ncbi:hypothetical protein U1Q18_014107 [Sarracenia purpurea var. burkii]